MLQASVGMKATLVLLFLLVAEYASATQFTIENHLGQTVNVQGLENFSLGPGQSRTIGVPNGWHGRIFAGDPAHSTLAEFSINSWNGLDFYDLSVIDGFSYPMQIIPQNGGCPTVRCPSRGCGDAYQYPTDDTKTHGCATTNYRILFSY